MWLTRSHSGTLTLRLRSGWKPQIKPWRTRPHLQTWGSKEPPQTWKLACEEGGQVGQVPKATKLRQGLKPENEQRLELWARGWKEDLHLSTWVLTVVERASALSRLGATWPSLVDRKSWGSELGFGQQRAASQLRPDLSRLSPLAVLLRFCFLISKLRGPLPPAWCF